MEVCQNKSVYPRICVYFLWAWSINRFELQWINQPTDRPTALNTLPHTHFTLTKFFNWQTKTNPLRDLCFQAIVIGTITNGIIVAILFFHAIKINRLLAFRHNEETPSVVWVPYELRYLPHLVKRNENSGKFYRKIKKKTHHRLAVCVCVFWRQREARWQTNANKRWYTELNRKNFSPNIYPDW